jgi:lysozyme
VAKTLKLTNFEAPSQDMAALYLVQRRGVLGNLDRHGLNAHTLAALAKEWASLPNQRGASHYGQPVKSSKELISFYNASLARNRQPSQGA